MANVNVTYEEMTSTADQLSQGQSDLTDTLNRLKSIVDGLISSGFVTDSASGAFGETYTQFTSGATQTIGALDGLQTYLRRAADTMQQTDSSLASAIRHS